MIRMLIQLQDFMMRMKETIFTVNGLRCAIVEFPVSEMTEHLLLTPAETEVCRLIMRGHSNKCIADIRGTSVSTTANQITEIFRKLNVSSRDALIFYILTGKRPIVR